MAEIVLILMGRAVIAFTTNRLEAVRNCTSLLQLEDAVGSRLLELPLRRRGGGSQS